MRRLFIVLAVWVLAAGTCLLSGEVVRLKGQVVLQNSNGTPVPDAQVFALGVASTVTDSSGYFEFKFSNRKPGDLIKLNVVKKGLEVVNKKDLDVVLKTDTQQIEQVVMCEIGTRDKYAAIYYGIAETAIIKSYEELLKQLEGDVKDRDKTIARLREEKDAALAQAEKMAKDFAAVNLDEASEMYKKAFELFKKGDIDGALQVLDDDKLAKTLHEVARSYMLKADLYILKLDFKNAETYYRKAVEAEPGNLDHIIAVTAFFYKQKKFRKAQLLTEKALSMTGNKSERAAFLSNLGVLYSNTSRFKEAEQAYSEALDNYRTLAAANKDAYLPYVATTLNNLGTLYSDTSRFKEAEQAYSEALDNYRTLAAANKDAYLPDVAMTIHNLGLFHALRKNFPEAFAKLNETREIRETLAHKNPPAFDLDLCSTLIPLGILHTLSPEGSKETALSLFNRAISILKKYPDVPQAKQYLEIAEKFKKN